MGGRRFYLNGQHFFWHRVSGGRLCIRIDYIVTSAPFQMAPQVKHTFGALWSPHVTPKWQMVQEPARTLCSTNVSAFWISPKILGFGDQLGNADFANSNLGTSLPRTIVYTQKSYIWILLTLSDSILCRVNAGGIATELSSTEPITNGSQRVAIWLYM